MSSRTRRQKKRSRMQQREEWPKVETQAVATRIQDKDAAGARVRQSFGETLYNKRQQTWVHLEGKHRR